MPVRCIITCLAERVRTYHSPFHCTTGRHSSTQFLYALINGRIHLSHSAYLSQHGVYLPLSLSLAKRLEISFDSETSAVTTEVEWNA